jgi:competence protein ComEA
MTMTRFSRVAAAALAFAVAGVLFVSPVHAEKAAPASKVNINSANAQQLEALPGVGPALAGRIVEYRQKSGGFKSAQELLNVKGIGEKNFAKIQAYVVVGSEGAAPKGEAASRKAAAPKSEGE